MIVFLFLFTLIGKIVAQNVISIAKTKLNDFGWHTLDISQDKCAFTSGPCEDAYFPGYYVDFHNHMLYASGIFKYL